MQDRLARLSIQTLSTPTLSFLEGMAHLYVEGAPEPVYKLWGPRTTSAAVTTSRAARMRDRPPGAR
jgi:hypothetical protein